MYVCMYVCMYIYEKLPLRRYKMCNVFSTHLPREMLSCLYDTVMSVFRTLKIAYSDDAQNIPVITLGDI